MTPTPAPGNDKTTPGSEKTTPASDKAAPASDKTAPSQTESIALEFDLHHPPQKVWRALTDPELLAEWLLPIVSKDGDSSGGGGGLGSGGGGNSGGGGGFEPGVAFTFKASPPPGSGWDGIVNCRVLEIETHRKLSYTWVVGDMDTIVTFTLTPAPGKAGTRLSLVHSGFKPHQKHNFAGARYGWKMMGGKLVDLLARTP